MIEQQKILRTVIELPKEESAFLYFQLEANEGLCFYSTLDNEEGELFRTIEMKTHISLRTEFQELLDSLSKVLKINLISQEISAQ